MTNHTIAWIGLGKTGLPIATRLAGAGRSVTGYDRDQGRIAAAREAGVAAGRPFGRLGEGRRLVTESAVASPMVKYKAVHLAERDFTSTFSYRQMAKDLDLIVAAGRATEVAMPLAAQTRETYGALIGLGAGDEDFISTVRLSECLAGLGEPEKQ